MLFPKPRLVFRDGPQGLFIACAFSLARPRDRNQVTGNRTLAAAANRQLDVRMRLHREICGTEHRLGADRNWSLDAVMDCESRRTQNRAERVSREWVGRRQFPH